MTDWRALVHFFFLLLLFSFVCWCVCVCICGGVCDGTQHTREKENRWIDDGGDWRGVLFILPHTSESGKRDEVDAIGHHLLLHEVHCVRFTQLKRASDIQKQRTHTPPSPFWLIGFGRIFLTHKIRTLWHQTPIPQQQGNGIAVGDCILQLVPSGWFRLNASESSSNGRRDHCFHQPICTILFPFIFSRMCSGVLRYGTQSGNFIIEWVRTSEEMGSREREKQDAGRLETIHTQHNHRTQNKIKQRNRSHCTEQEHLRPQAIYILSEWYRRVHIKVFFFFLKLLIIACIIP